MPKTARSLAVVLSLFALAIVVLLAILGRRWWCEAGDARLWSWDIWSRHNSQHLVDPYSLSHVQHGIGLYVLLSWLGGTRLSVSGRVIAIALIEAIWEVVENTSWMIQRYREATLALDYYGDSIANSLSDYGMCLLGILLAWKIPARGAIAVFVLLELTGVLWIRDSLLLNMLMLLWPLEAIRQWQIPS